MPKHRIGGLRLPAQPWRLALSRQASVITASDTDAAGAAKRAWVQPWGHALQPGATISSLLQIHENGMAGFDELSDEVQYRYQMLIGSIGNLMFSPFDAEQERKALAA